MSNISNLTKALLKAQTQMGSATKGSKNPFFKSNYADLPTVMEVVKGPLNENGILVLQATAHKDGKNFINTSLIHADTGEALTSETEVICSKPNDPQAFGSAQTYARRFGLQSFLFIPAEDDDGNYSSGKTNSKGNPVTTTPAVQSKSPAAQNLADLVTAVAANPDLAVMKTNPAPLVSSSFSKKKKDQASQAAKPDAPSPASLPTPPTVAGQNLFE